MKLGTENKRNVVILAVLAAVAAYLLYANVLAPVSGASSGEASSGAPPAPRAIAPPPSTPSPDGPEEVRVGPPTGASRQVSGRIQSDEFHPTLRAKRPEDRIDPMGIDPTLRLDLLAKVQAVDLAGGERNLFQFAPPPKPDALKGPEPKILPKPPAPPGTENKEGAKPGETPPPPITLKYYGYSTMRDNGLKTAFFLDGDDILMAVEGEVVNKRYRVVRIGVSSVVMEDTESKRQQTLPLQPDAV